MENSFSIELVSISGKSQYISIKKHDPVRCLIIHGQIDVPTGFNCIFVHKNICLHPYFSFSCQGIGSGDHINYFLVKNSDKYSSNLQRQVTSDKAKYNQLISSLISSIIYRIDLNFSSMETNRSCPSIYNQIQENNERIGIQEENHNESSKDIVIQSSSSINSNPLPMIWPPQAIAPNEKVFPSDLTLIKSSINQLISNITGNGD